ncbi:cytochrome P450 [Xylariaceae sp. FL0255]|nr:cytochrome P450 [Xylariaceae sp. FL0255]
MASISTLILCLGLATYTLLYTLLRLTQSANEPPAIQTSIPFISPIFGMLSGMQKFSVRMRDKYGLPIYTLRLPGQRMYIVNSLPLIQLLQREIKTVAFAPIEAQAAATVMGVGPAGNAIIGSEKMFESDSYLSTFIPSTHPALSPGLGLDALNGTAIKYIADSLKHFHSQGPEVIELFSWIWDRIFMATTEAIYGPRNPFKDLALQKAWYDFEPWIVVHMLKLWPSVLAPKSLYARDKLLIPSLEKYFSEHGHQQGSLLVQCRYKHNTEHGLRGRDVAATEIGQMTAAVTNSVASAFWLVYHIFSNPHILKECQQEVDGLVQMDQHGVNTVDLAHVKSSCPVLLSTWQETLRYNHIGVSARVVMRDFILDNKYLLKKGATVMSCMPVQHSDPALWGETAREYDHRRFIRTPGSKRKTTAAAFRSFGGGSMLCPGRHFVSTEVMAFAALLLLQFELKPEGSVDGKWSDPRKSLPMTTSIPTPKDRLLVKLVPRDSTREWRVEFSGSSKGFSMVAEDVDNTS